MEKLISVIIPVYNVEEYLGRCVDSVLQQSFSDYEILLIDDGSTDHSGEMCDSLAKLDDRIRVIHKENGGLSDARNCGMEAAEAEYLFFLDSDDYIEPTALEKLYGLAREHKAAIAIGSVMNCYEGRRNPQYDHMEYFTCDGIDAVRYMLMGKKISGSACGKLYQKKVCGHQRFIVGRTYEDAFFLPEVLASAKRVVVTTEPLYNYWHRSGSITTKCNLNTVMDIVDAYLATLEFVKMDYPKLLPVAEFRLYWAYFTVLDRLLQLEKYQKLPQYQASVTFLKKNWWNIVRCKYFAPSRRIAAIFLKINVWLYKQLSYANRKRYGVYGA